MPRPGTRIAIAACKTVMSACWTSACWLLWMVLAVVAVSLVVIHFTRAIPVPQFLLQRLEAQFDAAQLQPRFGATRFDPTGKLVLEDVRIHSPLFNEPLASARAISLNLNFWAIALRDFDVDSVDIHGLELDCPAMFSPSGVSLPVIGDLHATFKRDGRTWSVPRIDFKTEQLAASFKGEWDPRVFAIARLPATARDWVRRYYQVARVIARHLPEIAALGEARLDGEFVLLTGEPLRLSIDARTDRLGVRGVSLSNPRLRATIDDTRAPLLPIVVEFDAFDALVESRIAVSRPRVHATGELDLERLKFTPGPVEFLSDRLDFGELAIDGLIFRTSLAALPVVEGELSGLFAGSLIRVLGSVDPQAGDFTGNVEAFLNAATLDHALEMIARRVPGRQLQRFAFGGPLNLNVNLQLGDWWQFQGAQGRFSVLDAGILGVATRSASGFIDITNARLLGKDLMLDAPGLRASGSYEMDNATLDYRFLARGRVVPEVIEPWFSGSWWPDFWDRFSISPDSPPDADLVVGGRWGDRTQTVVDGSVRTGPMAVYGLPFDRVFTRIFIRDRYYDAFDIDVSAGGRRATGSYLQDDRPSGERTRRIAVNVRSRLEFPRYARLAGSEVLDIVKPFVFEDTADLAVTGKVDFNGPAFSEDLAVTAESTGTFRFFEFPVQNARLGLHVKDGVVDVHNIEAGLASGRLVGTAFSSVAPEGRMVRFESKLRGAKVDELSAVYADFFARSFPGETQPDESTREILGGKGILTLDIEGVGPADDIWGFTGSGSATISDADFGRIRLLGPLSRLFEKTIFNFSSFKLTNAQATFALNGDSLAFDRLDFTGPSARLKAAGNYTMPTAGLEFNATLFPFRESSMPIFGLIGLVLDPFSRVFEVRLTGTLDKPRWGFAAGSPVPPPKPMPAHEPAEPPAPESRTPETPAAPAGTP